MDVTTLVNIARKAVKHEHHYIFLLACADASVIPKGLAVKKPVCINEISTHNLAP